jgi:thioesterase domain-containing protein/acyl carrier protein
MLADADPAGPPFRAQPDDRLALFYTSGTTGRPKGAVQTHAQQLAFALARVMETGCNLGDRALAPIPLHHTAARSNQLSHHLRSAAVVLLSRPDPVELLRAIEHERVTLISVAPTMLQMMFDVPDFDSYDLTSLKTILYGGAPMPVALLKRGLKKFGPIFMSIYAQTESGGTSLRKHHHRLDDETALLRRLQSVGQPYLGTKLKIVDDQDNELPIGEVGEVCFKSDSAITSYWRDEAATREALRDGWFHTGDMGRLDADGFLFLVDRKKDMIIVGGNNVYSKEVEDVLLRHPGLEHAAVIGVPDSFWGEAVRAVVVTRPGAVVTEAELAEFCGGFLGRYKCPSSVIFARELPMLPTGKINKSILRERHGAAHRAMRSIVAGSADVSPEAAMTALWERVLRRAPIRRDENFFDLGGDSLAALQLSIEIEQKFGRPVPISWFYVNTTVAAMMAAMSNPIAGTESSPLVQLRGGGAGPPLFIVHGSGGSCVNLVKLTRRLSLVGPIYGLQARGIDGAGKPLSRVEHMAGHYLDAILKVQPQGPYLLAGYSFGGLVAFEMARRLSAAGVQVAELLLLDSHPHFKSWPRSERVALGFDRLSLFRRRWIEPIRRFCEELGKLRDSAPVERTKRIRLLRRWLKSGVSARLLPLSNAFRWRSKKLAGLHFHQDFEAMLFPKAIVDVQRACLKAEACYRPAAYPGKATLIQPKPDYTPLWSSIVAQLEVVTTPGTHHGRLEGPALDHLIAVIDRCLLQYTGPCSRL